MTARNMDDRDIDSDEIGVAGTQPTGSESGPVEELVGFVEYMASNLVQDPATIRITPVQHGSNIHIKLTVPEDEMGRVIGRQGRIARAMRTLLTIAASRKGLRSSLDIDS